MGGWKEIHGTVLCAAPCCPGYVERVERPPLLAPLVFCRKIGTELENPVARMYEHYWIVTHGLDEFGDDDNMEGFDYVEVFS